MTAEQLACTHQLIVRPATEAKRKKDLEDYLGAIATRYIFSSTKGPVRELKIACPP